MSDFGPQLAADVLAACQAGAGEAAQGFSRTFDRPIQVDVGEASTLAMATRLVDCSGPGLVIVLTVGEAAAVVLVPEASGLLPAWYAEPDATGRSKLTTLAQELGMLLLPESAMPDDFQAARVADLNAALARGGPKPDAGAVSLLLSSAGAAGGAALIVWPLPNKGAILSAPTAPEVAVPEATAPGANSASSPAAAVPPVAPAAPPRATAATPTRARPSTGQLPGYSKSLLRIRVPLQVILAKKKQQVGRIIELGPGSIINFDKPCDETLELCVCGHKIALGEAVKVGDKFGLRVTSLSLPDERFKTVRPG